MSAYKAKDADGIIKSVMLAEDKGEEVVQVVETADERNGQYVVRWVVVTRSAR